MMYCYLGVNFVLQESSLGGRRGGGGHHLYRFSAKVCNLLGYVLSLKNLCIPFMGISTIVNQAFCCYAAATWEIAL